MPQTFIFGTGNLIVKSTATNGQATVIGTLQKVQVDIDIETVALRGQNKFPDAIAQGAAKVTGKISFGKFDMYLPSLVTGASVTTGAVVMSFKEAASIPASSPYTITPTNAATFAGDLGVVLASDGTPFTPVTSSPAAGQYSVNTTTGVYTFAAADTGKAVLISYKYTSSSTAAQKSILSNSLMGSQVTFGLTLQGGFTEYGTQKQIIMDLPACVSSKFSLPMQNTNFTIQDMDFEAFANAAGTVYTLSTI